MHLDHDSFQLLNTVSCNGGSSRKSNMVFLYLVRKALFLNFFKSIPFNFSTMSHVDLETGIGDFRSLSCKFYLAGCGRAQHQGFASPVNSCFSTPPETSGALVEIAVVLLPVTQNQRSPTLGQSPSAELSGLSGWLLPASPCSNCCCPSSCKPTGFCLHGPNI